MQLLSPHLQSGVPVRCQDEWRSTFNRLLKKSKHSGKSRSTILYIIRVPVRLFVFKKMSEWVCLLPTVRIILVSKQQNDSKRFIWWEIFFKIKKLWSFKDSEKPVRPRYWTITMNSSLSTKEKLVARALHYKKEWEEELEK